KRAVTKDKSGIDWDKFHDILNKVSDEIKNNLVYRFIKIDGAEGDDIIATITKYFGARFEPEDASPFFNEPVGHCGDYMKDHGSSNHTAVKMEMEMEKSVEKILIVSGDKDFPQLQLYNNVEQYDPIHK